jgi:hypothetical protein
MKYRQELEFKFNDHFSMKYCLHFNNYKRGDDAHFVRCT